MCCALRLLFPKWLMYTVPHERLQSPASSHESRIISASLKLNITVPTMRQMPDVGDRLQAGTQGDYSFHASSHAFSLLNSLPGQDHPRFRELSPLGLGLHMESIRAIQLSIALVQRTENHEDPNFRHRVPQQ
mmetsp:Transcript_2506/g.6647  ORF Transcript_2506/g.6647 Transcript_2506/m.6647 type:complete len:132 (+) Transcript_2506:50-445(+)